jgi:hypothetical protein
MHDSFEELVFDEACSYCTHADDAALDAPPPRRAAVLPPIRFAPPPVETLSIEEEPPPLPHLPSAPSRPESPADVPPAPDDATDPPPQRRRFSTLDRPDIARVLTLTQLRQLERAEAEDEDEGCGGSSLLAAGGVSKWLRARGKFHRGMLSVGVARMYEECFRMLDVDNSGTLDAAEIAHAMAALGFKASRRDVQRLVDRMDRDNSGTIDLDEVGGGGGGDLSPQFFLIIVEAADGLFYTGNPPPSLRF